MKEFATRLGVATTGENTDIVLQLCDYLEKEWYKPGYEESAIVKALGPEERQKVWRSLDIFSGGIYRNRSGDDPAIGDGRFFYGYNGGSCRKQ